MDNLILQAIKNGHMLLEKTYSAEMLQWARATYLYDHNDVEFISLMYCASESVPITARLLLLDILNGDRKPNRKRAAQIKYDIENAWSAALNVIALRRTHRNVRHNFAERTGQDLKPVDHKMKEILEKYTEAEAQSLGVGESTMQKILADIEKRLKKLPEL